MDPRRPATPTQPAAMKSRGPEKDEFGRDIRPGSVDREPAPTSTAKPPPFTPTITPAMQNPLVAQDPTPSHQNPTPDIATTLAMADGAQPETPMPIATYESRSRDPGTSKGPDSFDPATFDFTSPASWEALGKTWEATNGVAPTQEMLMQFVMMSSMGMGMGMGIGMGGFGMEQPQGQWEGAQGSEGWSAGGPGWSGGGVVAVEEMQGQEGPDGETVSPEKEDSPVLGERSVGSSGKMQKVGDRWVFVRS